MGKLHHVDFHHNMLQQHPVVCTSPAERIRHEPSIQDLTRDEFDAWEQAHMSIRARQVVSRDAGRITMSDVAWTAVVTRMRPLRASVCVRFEPKRRGNWLGRLLDWANGV